MSSADRTGRGVPGLAGRVAGLMLSLALLAGCQVRPLYAPDASGVSARDQLPAIVVDAPVTRQEQVFRNVLLFGLRGGGEATSSLYQLNYRMTFDVQQQAIEKVTGTPTTYQIAGRIAYILENAATGEPLLVDEALATASYNRSSQNLANLRGERDAEDRMATDLAHIVETRLATYFAAR
jgi:LPS-assembly lipoprotein